MNVLSNIFVMAVLLHLVVTLWLGFRQIKYIKKFQNAVPKEFADNISLEEHQKSAVYSIAKKKFAMWNAPVAAALILFWTLGGGFEWFDEMWRSIGWTPLWTGVAFLISISLVMGFIDLPASLYSTFVLEEKYGFNRTTLKTFFGDMIKGSVLSLVIGVPLIWVVLWLMGNSGSLWWLWVWMTWLGFSALMMWLYPTVIAPLFNKFNPLEDEALNSIIAKLLARAGFSSNGIFVMDGSKRSGHGNAYFTGFGSNKRIVFFDTLLESLSHDEVEAVLAHELGHFKHNHIKKGMLVMALVSLFSLWLLGMLIDENWFYHGLGMAHMSDYAALILFFTALPVFSFFITPIMSWFSRKHEYEADAFAVQQADGNALISALVGMYKDNASTLTPDPLHSLVYDSHPPAPLRIAHIKQAL